MKQRIIVLSIQLILLMFLFGCNSDTAPGVTMVGYPLQFTEEDSVTVKNVEFSDDSLVVELEVSFSSLALERFSQVYLKKAEDNAPMIFIDEEASVQMNSNADYASSVYEGKMYLVFTHEALKASEDLESYNLWFALGNEKDGTMHNYGMAVK